jgi:hypothetical protein
MSRLLSIAAALLVLSAPLGAQGAGEESVVTELRLHPTLNAASNAGRALGATELEHVARRLARELGGEARPAPFEARDGSAVYLLGPNGEDGRLLLSGQAMGHAFEAAEVPGHGGELLRIPQLVVGVRHLAPGLDARCGVAVLEMQLDPKTGVPHASGLRALTWANVEDVPLACGRLRQLVRREQGQDGLVFEAVVLDRRDDAERPPAYREWVTASLLPGGFVTVGELEREKLASGPTNQPLLIERHGVDEVSVIVPAEDEEVGSALVRAIASRLPEVRVLETTHGWGWTRIQLEGPREQVDAFLATLQEDEQSGSLSAELIVRSGELARATVRFRTEE